MERKIKTTIEAKMTETQPLAKLKEIAQKVGNELKQDENNLSLLIFGSVATGKILEKPDLDLLLVTTNAPVEMEPKNVEERKIDGEIVQISRITPERLERDVRSFIDYRINQIREGVILFDKSGLIQEIKKELKKRPIPSREVLETWLSDLKEDVEILPQKIDSEEELLFLTNRSSLWALRIILLIKGDPFRGSKYLEDHLEHYPEIKDQFLKASGTDLVNLEIKTKLESSLPPENDNVHLLIARDKLVDGDELEEIGKTTAAKASLLDAITYFGLYLQEREKTESWEGLIKKNRPFAELVKLAFGEANPKALLRDYLEFNKAVAASVKYHL